MIPAAQYIRVSSDQQKHSLAGQAAQIAAFAADQGYVIVASYEDRGRSGLRLKGRTGLQRLLADVLAGSRTFAAVLVQDVSRWGRFQDSDEAAHYEYICRQAGVEVRYCAEAFEEMSGRTGDLLKAVRRLMAADFSRELSEKVRRAQYRHAAQGRKMGGVAGYGLRRAVLGADGQVKAVLELGEQRLLRGDRVIYVPGPDTEVATVRRIFRLFLDDGLGLADIARLLNAEQVVGEGGRTWATWTIGTILANPKYTGGYLFGRRRRTLDGHRLKTDPKTQVQLEDVFEPIVPKAWLTAASAKRRQRMRFLAPEETWRRLQSHAGRQDEISPRSLGLDPNLPSHRTCARLFGPIPRLSARLGLYPSILSGQIDSGRSPRNGTRRPSQEQTMPATYTAFLGPQRLAAGDLTTVAIAAHDAQDRRTEMPIVFDDTTGLVIDLDLRGSPDDVISRLPKPAEGDDLHAPRGRGRPRLGVTAREITLLPKHWAWLQSQPGGASAVLRRLVEQAQAESAETDAQRQAQTATYKVMYALAGHLGGYEDALRALYAGDEERFASLVGTWPADVSTYVRRLAANAFSPVRAPSRHQG